MATPLGPPSRAVGGDGTVARKQKFYVVWKGSAPGVYGTWAECESATRGSSGAKFKSFPSLESAQRAYGEGPGAYWGSGKLVSPLSEQQLAAIGRPIGNSLCVDAAWNSETKVMEYRGVWGHDRSVAFHKGPFPQATNNLGEFLAIVHALALMTQRGIDWPVYSDSKTAISWVRRGKVNSKSMNRGQTGAKVNDFVARALRWLAENEYKNQVLKWETGAWGEVPADFGRK